LPWLDYPGTTQAATPVRSGATAFAIFPAQLAFGNLMSLPVSTVKKPFSVQPQGTQPRLTRYPFTTTMEDNMLKGIALWAMGVPVVVIILLYMFVF